MAVAPLPAPGQRGQTVIADRVVARLAARAVAEVEQTGGAARHLIGVAIGRQTGAGAARVSARAFVILPPPRSTLSPSTPLFRSTLTRYSRLHLLERDTGLPGPPL